MIEHLSIGLATLGFAGCQVVFPLEGERVEPAVCPELGIPLAFDSPTLNLVTTRNCRNYTRSSAADLAVGLCANGSGASILEGPVDEDLQPSQLVTRREAVTSVVIATEGDRLFTTETEITTLPDPATIETYAREGDAWVHVEQTPSPLSQPVIGAPSRGPNARMFVNDPSALEFVELEEQSPGSWIEHARYLASETGEVVADNHAMHLTPDGLRLSYAARMALGFLSVLGYAERTSTDERFTSFVAIVLTANIFADANLSDGCDRVYLSQTSGVFFSTQ